MSLLFSRSSGYYPMFSDINDYKMKLMLFRQLETRQRSKLTDGGLQWMTHTSTPARGVNVPAIIVHPIIVDIGPTIEVNLDLMLRRVAYRGNSYQDGVTAIHSLGLHSLLVCNATTLQIGDNMLYWMTAHR